MAEMRFARGGHAEGTGSSLCILSNLCVKKSVNGPTGFAVEMIFSQLSDQGEPNDDIDDDWIFSPCTIKYL
jgi:hypothetical protein